MTSPPATPGAATAPPPPGIARLALPDRPSPGGLADLLGLLPEEVAGLPRRDIQTGADSATAIYLTGEESGQPRFGMIVLLIVPPRDDADAVVAALQRERWGSLEDQTMTASGSGDTGAPAFREFWRTFPPGLFALPNQPVYFLIAYRAGSGSALMVIASSPAIRTALAEALAGALPLIPTGKGDHPPPS